MVLLISMQKIYYNLFIPENPIPLLSNTITVYLPVSAKYFVYLKERKNMSTPNKIQSVEYNRYL